MGIHCQIRVGSGSIQQDLAEGIAGANCQSRCQLELETRPGVPGKAPFVRARKRESGRTQTRTQKGMEASLARKVAELDAGLEIQPRHRQLKAPCRNVRRVVREPHDIPADPVGECHPRRGLHAKSPVPIGRLSQR